MSDRQIDEDGASRPESDPGARASFALEPVERLDKPFQVELLRCVILFVVSLRLLTVVAVCASVCLGVWSRCVFWRRAASTSNGTRGKNIVDDLTESKFRAQRLPALPLWTTGLYSKPPVEVRGARVPEGRHPVKIGTRLSLCSYQKPDQKPGGGARGGRSRSLLSPSCVPA